MAGMNTSLLQSITQLSADGDSTVIAWQGGKGMVQVFGTFGSGTMTLSVLDPVARSTYVPVQNGVWTSSEARSFDFPENAKLRFTLAGATGPTINANFWYGNQ